MKTYRGDRIRALREQRGLKQYELAMEAGISQGHLSRIESGSLETVGSYVLDRLATVLNTNPGYLMGTTDDARPSRALRRGELLQDEQALVEDYRDIHLETFKRHARDLVRQVRDTDAETRKLMANLSTDDAKPSER